jgi:hypothetical protein
MERSRAGRSRGPHRRRPLTSAEGGPAPAIISDQENIVGSPEMSPNTTPQTLPQARRGPKSSLSHSFTFTTPTPPSMSLRGPNQRKRPRTMDSYEGAADDDESNQKGGHSLRKRTRVVDYSFEHLDEDVSAASKSPLATRGRKRRVDAEDDPEDFSASSLKKRFNEKENVFDTTPGGRRKSQSRRAIVDSGPYDGQSYDNNVKDTIEVGVAFDDQGESDEEFQQDSENTEPSSQESSADQVKGEDTPVHQAEAARQFPKLVTASSVPSTTMMGGEISTSPTSIIPPRDPPIRIILHHSKAEAERPTATTIVLTKKEDPLSRAATPDKSIKSATPSPVPEQPSETILSEPHLPDVSVEQNLRPDDLDTPIIINKAHEVNVPDANTPSIEITSVEDNAIPASTPASAAALPVAPTTTTGIPDLILPGAPIHDSPAEQGPSPSPQGQIEGDYDEGEMEAEVIEHLSPDLNGHLNKWELLTPYMPDERVVHPAVYQDEPPLRFKEKKEKSLQNTAKDISADKVSTGADTPIDRPSTSWNLCEAKYLVRPLTNNFAAETDRDDAENAQDESEQPEADIDAEAEDDDIEEEDEPPEDDDGMEQDVASTTTKLLPVIVPDSIPPSGANSPAAVADSNTSTRSTGSNMDMGFTEHKYYSFRKLRDPTEFATAIKGYAKMPTGELYNFLEHINLTLVAWQDEYSRQMKIVDDHENTVRRQQQDAEYEKKTADLNAYSKIETYMEKDLEMRGYRAVEKAKDRGVWYSRGQDKVMAAAYGFEYDSHPSKVGKQDPSLQREGIITRRMLRNQPRQTAKATEAEEASSDIVTGKRTRKPRQHFDGMVNEDVSRSGTPAPSRLGPGGRRRRGTAFEADEESRHVAEDQGGMHDPSVEDTPTKGTRGRRRKTGSDSAAFHTNYETNATAEPQEYPRPGGKRRGRQPRLSKLDDISSAATGDFPGSNNHVADEDPKKRGRGRKPATGDPPITPTFANSFYSATASAVDESRPTTSSSNASGSSENSTYSFRPKRQRDFKSSQGDDEEPPRKRTRRVTIKKHDSANQIHQGPIATGHSYTAEAQGVTTDAAGNKHLFVSFRNPDSRSHTPNPSSVFNSPNQGKMPKAVQNRDHLHDTDELSEKDYASMTKSEKMSYSMKSKFTPYLKITRNRILANKFEQDVGRVGP